MTESPRNLVEYRRGKPLCWIAPSVTFYLRDPPDGQLALSALEVFRGICPSERQKLVTGSRAPGFAPLGGAIGQRILSSHLELMNRRKDQAIGLWDGEILESWYFNITGVPKENGQPRASFCQASFPNDVDPPLVVELTKRWAEVLPFLSGHAGLTAQFDADSKHAAFHHIFGWAKRYPGLEVEDLNVTVHHVLDAVKGANWLTMVGSGLWTQLVGPAGPAPDFGPGISLLTTPHGAIIRAGERPVLGDRNAARFPEAYAAVEQRLAPIKVQAHAEFTARFEEERATMLWLRRLLDPDGWLW